MILISMNNVIDRKTERIVSFDYLRIFATLAVIILHVSAENWRKVDVNCFEWKVFNFFDGISRWGVPVFVMISGALFLGRDISVSDLYKKYIPRLAVSFVIWSTIYTIASGKRSWDDRIDMIVHGHYHLWFIPMIIGLYICVPILKLIVTNKRITKYYLILAFVTASIIPGMMSIIKDLVGGRIDYAASLFNDVLDSMDINIALGYVGYFLLGYYLNKNDLNRNKRVLIYLLGVAGFAFTVIISLIVSLKTQIPCLNYYKNYNVNIVFESVSVFTFFKYSRLKPRDIVYKFSGYSFGAYLIHALIIEQLRLRLGLNTMSFNPVISVPAISLIVYILSFMISAVLNQIPYVKKYMV